MKKHFVQIGTETSIMNQFGYKHKVQKALKISSLMCVVISNLLAFFKASKNNCLIYGLKNEIYQYFIYIQFVGPVAQSV